LILSNSVCAPIRPFSIYKGRIRHEAKRSGENAENQAGFFASYFCDFFNILKDIFLKNLFLASIFKLPLWGFFLNAEKAIQKNKNFFLIK